MFLWFNNSLDSYHMPIIKHILNAECLKQDHFSVVMVKLITTARIFEILENRDINKKY